LNGRLPCEILQLCLEIKSTTFTETCGRTSQTSPWTTPDYRIRTPNGISVKWTSKQMGITFFLSVGLIPCLTCFPCFVILSQKDANPHGTTLLMSRPSRMTSRHVSSAFSSTSSSDPSWVSSSQAYDVTCGYHFSKYVGVVSFLKMPCETCRLQFPSCLLFCRISYSPYYINTLLTIYTIMS